MIRLEALDRLKSCHIFVLHYWNMGIHSAKKIHRYTKIPSSTISYQFKRQGIQAFPEYQAATGRKLVIDAKCSRKLGQFIRQNNEGILKELVEK